MHAHIHICILTAEVGPEFLQKFKIIIIKFVTGPESPFCQNAHQHSRVDESVIIILTFQSWLD